MKKYLLTLIALVAITVSVQAQSHSYKALLRTNKEVTFSWGAGSDQYYELYYDNNKIGNLWVKVKEDKTIEFTTDSKYNIDIYFEVYPKRHKKADGSNTIQKWEERSSYFSHDRKYVYTHFKEHVPSRLAKILISNVRLYSGTFTH